MPHGVFEAPRGRAAAVITSIHQDTADPARGAPAPTVGQYYEDNPKPTWTLIEKLWNHPDNTTDRDKFLNNELVKNCAGDENNKHIDKFRSLEMQDYLWLRDWVQFKALRIATIPEDDFDIGHYDTLKQEVANLQKSTNYLDDAATLCTETLGIEKSKLQSANRGVAELAYGNFLQNHSARIDWFDLHVFMIACTYGWYKLAQNHEKEENDGLFYQFWVKENKSDKSAAALSNFLDANATFWGSKFDTESIEVDENGNPIDKEATVPLKDEKGHPIDKGHRWNKLLRTALRLETAMFNEAWNSLK